MVYQVIMQNKQLKKSFYALVFTNAPPAIAPHGALKTLFGTNPICFGTPTSSKVPFILDSSVSMINRGKIRVAARYGRKIPQVLPWINLAIQQLMQKKH